MLDIDPRTEAREEEKRRKTLSIENSFTYHRPKEDQIQRYEDIREAFKNMALMIDEMCPESREKSLAITKLEESSMWANKAIACNE